MNSNASTPASGGTPTPEQVWEYDFAVWPAGGWEPPVYEVFKAIRRQVMEFTEDEWAGFRESLARSGITVREVTRTRYQEPEIVF